MNRTETLRALAFLCLFAPLGRAEDLIAIRAGRILTAAGADIESGTVLVESGRIRAVGKDVEVPYNAQVISCPSCVVAPGLISAHTTAGLRAANESLPEVPYITVLDGIDPNAGEYKAALRDGVPASNVMPGNATRFGG